MLRFKPLFVKFTVSYRRIAIVEFGSVWTTKTRKRLFMRVFWISLDNLGRLIGAAGIEPASCRMDRPFPMDAVIMLSFHPSSRLPKNIKPALISDQFGSIPRLGIEPVVKWSTPAI
jgi:hypothetical protein